jgi:hypothetical protein
MRGLLVVIGLLLMLFGGGCVLAAVNLSNFGTGSFSWTEFWDMAPVWYPLGLGPIFIGTVLIGRNLFVGHKNANKSPNPILVLGLFLILFGIGCTQMFGKWYFDLSASSEMKNGILPQLIFLGLLPLFLGAITFWYGLKRTAKPTESSKPPESGKGS